MDRPSWAGAGQGRQVSAVEATCTATSRALGEPLLGTASRVRSWVLLQQQGPWGADALSESRLDPALARALSERARAAGVRIVLIRRPGRGAWDDAPQCYLAHTGPRVRFVEARRLAGPEDLLDADLDRLARGERPGFGTPRTSPLHLVCTNGKHDRCCATRGRPLADALAASHGEAVWECSHIGGDRFAANLVCFPHGLYYGGLDRADGPRVAAAYERGLIDLAHYRGRSSADPAAQAAEHFVREREGLLGVDDLPVVGRAATAGDEVTVTFAGPSGVHYRVRVQTTRAAQPRPLTCGAAHLALPPVYQLLALDTV
jgi:hypothetical protein